MGRRKKDDGCGDVKVEGRDFVFRSCQLIERAWVVRDAQKRLEKKLKEVVDKLESDIHDGVTEGPRSGMMFPSLEAADRKAQAVTIEHLELGAGLAQRLQDVPADSLEEARLAINEILDQTAPQAEEPEEEPAAEHRQAAE